MKVPVIASIAAALFSWACWAASARAEQEPLPDLRLSTWERGLAVTSVAHPDTSMFFWFYEWNMFDAVEMGQHSHGKSVNDFTVTDAARRAIITSSTPGLQVEAQVRHDSVELTLTATNRSGHDWPPLAAIIPCFNPGPALEKRRNENFNNTKTWFLGRDGLTPLHLQSPREIHFHHQQRAAVMAASPDGKYAWDEKWPLSDSDAETGLIVRESTDGKWVTGIAWERFLSVQGHNPWRCMHLSVLLGPLARGDTRTIRGRIYLFQGTKEEVLKRYRHDFAASR